MRLDDLLGDRQAETGILPEALMRPVGIEALENLIDGVGPDAGTVIVHDDLDLVLQPARRHPHHAVGGENERAFSIRLSITWPMRESWPGATKAEGRRHSRRSATR